MSNNSSRPVKAGDHLYLIDGSGYIFRAYHALPPLTRKSDGLPVGAVQGFCNMLYKLLKQMSEKDQDAGVRSAAAERAEMLMAGQRQPA